MSDVITSIVPAGNDPVRLWIKAKQSYAAKRKMMRATRLALDAQNRPYMLAGDTYPLTSYYDVASMAAAWTKATRQMGNTATSTRAWADWQRSMPSELAGAIGALKTYDDYSYLAKYLEKVASLRDAPYPNNEAFWGSGKVLAIAQSAAGGVPSPFELAVESVKEAVRDRINDLDDYVPCIRLDCLVPSWLIWASVGLGGLWIYSKVRKHA